MNLELLPSYAWQNGSMGIKNNHNTNNNMEIFIECLSHYTSISNNLYLYYNIKLCMNSFERYNREQYFLPYFLQILIYSSMHSCVYEYEWNSAHFTVNLIHMHYFIHDRNYYLSFMVWVKWMVWRRTRPLDENGCYCYEIGSIFYMEWIGADGNLLHITIRNLRIWNSNWNDK